MTTAGLELAISANERPQTHSLDSSANEIGKIRLLVS